MIKEPLAELSAVKWDKVAEVSRVICYAHDKGFITLLQAADVLASLFADGVAESVRRHFIAFPSPIEGDAVSAVEELALVLHEDHGWRDPDGGDSMPFELWREWVSTADVPSWVANMFHDVLDFVEQDFNQSN